MEIGDLRHLQIFDAGNSSLTGSIPANIFSISSLKWIYLGNNKLSGTLPIDICCNQSRLEVLFLPLNQLNGEVPSGLDRCHKLRFLWHISIASTAYGGVLPASIGNLSDSLLYFYVKSSQLKCNIPMEIGNLSRLIEFSVSNNDSVGPIPAVGRLQKLEELNLSSNFLKGSVPLDVGNLKVLISMDLSRNISCQVPPCKASSHYGLKKALVLVVKYILPAAAFAMLLVIIIVIFVRRDEMSLKDFVKESSFDSLTKVIDVTILQEGDVHFTAKTNCIWSVLELALDCSAESPDRRRNMVDVVAELKKIKTRSKFGRQPETLISQR
ncbi:hypothetical protein V6N13_132529 [Hibiscus sabdariffa]